MINIHMKSIIFYYEYILILEINIKKEKEIRVHQHYFVLYKTWYLPTVSVWMINVIWLAYLKNHIKYIRIDNDWGCISA